jgi:hypothetical protein
MILQTREITGRDVGVTQDHAVGRDQRHPGAGGDGGAPGEAGHLIRSGAPDQQPARLVVQQAFGRRQPRFQGLDRELVERVAEI